MTPLSLSLRNRLLAVALLGVISCTVAVFGLGRILQLTSAVRLERARDAVTVELEAMRRGVDCRPEEQGHSALLGMRGTCSGSEAAFRAPRPDLDEPTRGALAEVSRRAVESRGVAVRAVPTPEPLVVVVGAAPTDAGSLAWVVYSVRPSGSIGIWRIITVTLSIATLLLVGTAISTVVSVRRGAATLNASLEALAIDLDAPVPRPPVRELGGSRRSHRGPRRARSPRAQGGGAPRRRARPARAARGARARRRRRRARGPQPARLDEAARRSRPPARRARPRVAAELDDSAPRDHAARSARGRSARRRRPPARGPRERRSLGRARRAARRPARAVGRASAACASRVVGRRHRRALDADAVARAVDNLAAQRRRGLAGRRARSRSSVGARGRRGARRASSTAAPGVPTPRAGTSSSSRSSRRSPTARASASRSSRAIAARTTATLTYARDGTGVTLLRARRFAAARLARGTRR